MKLSTTTIAQILTVATSALSLISGAVPEKYAPIVAAVQGLISTVLHLVAGNSNPDGTPASVAYVPAAKTNASASGQ